MDLSIDKEESMSFTAAISIVWPKFTAEMGGIGDLYSQLDNLKRDKNRRLESERL